MVEFSVAWWNTSLYSYARSEKKRRLNKAHEVEVWQELTHLCKGSDIVFLGEFPAGEELNSMVTALNGCLHEAELMPPLRGESLFYKRNSKLEFHNAIVFRSDRTHTSTTLRKGLYLLGAA